MSSEKTLGQVAYEAYETERAKHCNGQNFPVEYKWLGFGQTAAWQAAAEAAVEAVFLGKSAIKMPDSWISIGDTHVNYSSAIAEFHQFKSQLPADAKETT